jgi:hypothetical protein
MNPLLQSILSIGQLANELLDQSEAVLEKSKQILKAIEDEE